MKKFIIFFSICILTILIISITVLYFYTKPNLTINGNEEIILKLNEVYKEEGATANVFGFDVSKNIKISGKVNTSKIGEYKVTYSIKLKFINEEASRIRIVKVTDSNSPVIELKGKDITIYKGQKYKEKGYYATDDYDGDLTDKVIVKSNLNINKIGKYKIIYSVVDSSNNKTSIERIITVKERPTTTADPNKNGDNTKVTNKAGTGTGVAILMYHYFYDEKAGETGADSNWMEIHDFEAQLKYLKDNNYYFPTWNEVNEFVNGKKTLPKKSIVITIDDGHKTLFSHAIPLLEKYQIPATSFIITSRSAAKKFKKYKSANINFQSHTHDMHQGGCSGGHGGLFRCINYEKGLADLKTSIQILGSNEAIAYPYGDVTNNVLNITKNAGFKIGVTTKYGKAKKGMNPLQLPRIRMYKGMSIKSFKNAI